MPEKKEENFREVSEENSRSRKWNFKPPGMPQFHFAADNPVRGMSLGLDKRRLKWLAQGLAEAPRAEVVRRRLEVLRQYPWSSYGALAGYRASPAWLWMKGLRALSGGRREGEQIRAVRHYTEEAVREGLTENPWEGLVGGVILGS